MGAEYPTFEDVSGARALLFLADSTPPPTPPSPAPALSDEFSCHSRSSSSYSGASARSCVSDSAQRGRPVDPLRVLSVVASLRRVDPKVLAEATSALFHTDAEKKRKGVWIEIDSGDDEDDQSERSSAVASEGSTVTAAASAGSTATSGRCRWAPRSGCAAGGKGPRRADVIMQWFSRPQARPATENDIRAAVGDNSGTSKAIRWLLKQEGGLRRAGTGGALDPYVYMIAAYGRGFVQASRSTWGQFEALPGMAALVDSDITSSVCLTGVTSGALCAALAGSWAFATHRHYTATVSLLAFYVGYLMTRIGMALPQACVGCYYVCYAENPTSRLFDGTIPDRLRKMQEGRDPLVPTPRFPHQPGGGV